MKKLITITSLLIMMSLSSIAVAKEYIDMTTEINDCYQKLYATGEARFCLERLQVILRHCEYDSGSTIGYRRCVNDLLRNTRN